MSQEDGVGREDVGKTVPERDHVGGGPRRRETIPRGLSVEDASCRLEESYLCDTSLTRGCG
jgi:hypothetical protein